MAITGIVHTKNEERDIARAIRSLRAVCEEVLVADMASSDSTREIAEREGATVVEIPDFGYVEPAWALALEHVTTSWALRIDADEIVPTSLAERLRQIVDGDEADVVLIGRRNFMFGDAIDGSGWAPESDRHYFLFKPSHLDNGAPGLTPIHTVVRPHDHARVTTLDASNDLSVWHFNYIDWQHFIEKMNRYTTVEAKEIVARGESGSARKLGREVITQLAWRGIRRRAWRDGYRGLGLVALMCTYRLVVHLKARQLATVGDADSIRVRYDEIAHRAMREPATR